MKIFFKKNYRTMWEKLTYTSGLDIYFFGLEINNSKNTLYMASLDVGGFCSGIKKSNYLPKDVSHTTTITQRMQIPKKPKLSSISPYYTVKQFYYKLSFFSTTMLKKPWFKEWRIAFRRKRINQKRHQMFHISAEKRTSSKTS